ncbi:MAG TPA: sodium:proton antiporter NhaD, partial [Cyclobacteriaceae bacterium]|nr:sodium:proton antiporter NhaD [Cyclobacteriaceae bacterium]
METIIIILFCVGYLIIALEHSIEINKTATALVTGVLCWTVYILNNDAHIVTEQLFEQLGETSGILFFLMGAMTIVELIDSHNGFEIINRAITTKNIRTLLWIICIVSFFLSAVLDNLTTTIVMVTLCAKLIRHAQQRLLFIGMIIIAANAGGSWSPIGDVTTTMLWIGGQISTTAIIAKLFIPSLVCLFVPLTIATFQLKNDRQLQEAGSNAAMLNSSRSPDQRLIFFSGIAVLLLVPAFKTLTHLPPFMGMLLGLGFLWILTELIHRNKNEEERQKLSVIHALERMDVPSVLFFLGILLAVGALHYAGQLSNLAGALTNTFDNDKIILTIIGIASAVVDNVPIVAATIAMYPLDSYPLDHSFWHLLAFCAGTGGSLLVIGSAAGVAAMGLENISFGWYVKRISWLALIGYFAGIATFIFQE